MLFAGKALLLGCRDDSAVFDKRGSTVMIEADIPRIRMPMPSQSPKKLCR